MSQDELAVMDGGKCILQLRGVRPFLSDKYDITAHPEYKHLSDYSKENKFDVARYVAHYKPNRANVGAMPADKEIEVFHAGEVNNESED